MLHVPIIHQRLGLFQIFFLNKKIPVSFDEKSNVTWLDVILQCNLRSLKLDGLSRNKSGRSFSRRSLKSMTSIERPLSIKISQLVSGSKWPVLVGQFSPQFLILYCKNGIFVKKIWNEPRQRPWKPNWLITWLTPSKDFYTINLRFLRFSNCMTLIALV